MLSKVGANAVGAESRKEERRVGWRRERRVGGAAAVGRTALGGVGSSRKSREKSLEGRAKAREKDSRDPSAEGKVACREEGGEEVKERTKES